MPFLESILQVVFVLFGILVIGLILLRRGEGGGLGGALGGGMGSDSPFGAKGAKALDKLIAWISAVFLLSAVLMYTPLIREGGLSSFNEPPVLGSFEIEPASPATGQSVKFIVKGVKDPNGHRVTVTFYEDDGDGHFYGPFEKELLKLEPQEFKQGEATASHTFDVPGKKVVWAVAEDDQSNTAVSPPRKVELEVTGEAIRGGAVESGN